MARRLRIPFTTLQKLDVAACQTDARVLVRDGDEHNIAALMRGEYVQLYFCGPRDMRLFAKQLEWVADWLQRDDFEVADGE